jgi:hypothetical protein
MHTPTGRSQGDVMRSSIGPSAPQGLVAPTALHSTVLMMGAVAVCLVEGRNALSALRELFAHSIFGVALFVSDPWS